MKKKILSVLLAVCLVLSLTVSASAYTNKWERTGTTAGATTRVEISNVHGGTSVTTCSPTMPEHGVHSRGWFSGHAWNADFSSHSITMAITETANGMNNIYPLSTLETTAGPFTTTLSTYIRPSSYPTSRSIAIYVLYRINWRNGTSYVLGGTFVNACR